MQKIFGYCRISKTTQNIDRQVRNILAVFPDAKIYKEAYTGTKTTGRKELDKILHIVQSGDTIVFDSVSRMSRNAAEGVELYMHLMDKGVDLVFLKEPHVNTDTYRQALNNGVEFVGNDIADIYIEATNKVLRLLAKKQIELAFGQAQKEVDDLHLRTAEGIETARRNGKQIGQRRGSKLQVKKAVSAKKIILSSSKSFGGTLTDEQCSKLAGISRKTYYKYKAALRAEQNTD